MDWFIAYVIGYRQGICVVPEPLAVFKIQPKSYYQRVRGDKEAYRSVLLVMLDLLSRPKYQDAAALIREGGSLYIFGWPMFKLVLNHPAGRRFLTPNFLRKCGWHSTKLLLKKFTPTIVGNLYLRLAGYRARAT